MCVDFFDAPLQLLWIDQFLKSSGDQFDRPADGKLHQFVAFQLIPELRIREQTLRDGFL